MSTLIGISSAVISGGCDGSYGAVMKITKKWEWENIWILFSITALALFPVGLAVWSVPDLLGVYREVSIGVVLRTFLFGLGWGIGSVFFGLGLYMLGQSFAYTVMMGIIAVGGALIPMLVTHPASALTVGGMIILLSMAVMVVGVAFCGWAGKLRDDGAGAEPRPTKRYHSFKLAFLVCLAGGIFSCLFNLAFHFAEPIAEAAAAQLGQQSTDFRANSPIWALAMLGGFLPNFLYCLYLLIQRGTWRQYRQPKIGHYWLWGIVMGAIFAADVTIYGIGASSLGPLGTTVAWLVYIASGILIANVWGVMTGEWKEAPPRARRHMFWGSMVLFASIILTSYGNYTLP
jgi:L-rhamnose-H+ transport protein